MLVRIALPPSHSRSPPCAGTFSFRHAHPSAPEPPTSPPQTYTTRCATLTDAYFDYLEGPGRADPATAVAAAAAAGGAGGCGGGPSPLGVHPDVDGLSSRLLLSGFKSGDGFGDPGRHMHVSAGQSGRKQCRCRMGLGLAGARGCCMGLHSLCIQPRGRIAVEVHGMLRAQCT